MRRDFLRRIIVHKNKRKEHLNAAGIAFDFLVYLPIFLSNLAGKM